MVFSLQTRTPQGGTSVLYNNEDLNRLMAAIITRGLHIDLEKGFGHKHTQVDPSFPRPPLKFALCTKEVRPEGRMLPEDIRMFGDFLWGYARRNNLKVPGIVAVPNVGLAIGQAMQSAAYDDGNELPAVKLMKDTVEGIERPAKLVWTNGFPSEVPLWLVDDVVHMGLSKKWAIDAVRAAQYDISDALVVLDYERGASQRMQELGVRLHSVLSVTSVLLFGQETGLITTEHLEAIRRYLSTAAA